MKCKGNFKFIELKKRDGGVFTNTQGREIKYKDSYSLKLNEVTDSGIYERVFRIPIDSKLVDTLVSLKPYTDIIVEFDINFYGTTIRVIPTAIIK